MDIDADEGFKLSPEEEESLLEAIAEADAGDFVDGEQFLRELKRQQPASRPDDPFP
jgi:hypothetical protein